MALLDADFIARRLESRFGLQLTGSSQEVDGGTFAAIRPVDLQRPNGFSIVVGRTPRIVEASLRLDGFTRSLLRQMSEADDTQRTLFSSLASVAISKKFRIGINVNEEYIEDFSKLPVKEWTKLELDCDYRLPSGKINEKEILNWALEVTSNCLGLVLCLLPIEGLTETVSGNELGLPEGSKILVEINRYERSPVNRAACIAHFGTSCQVCGFEFSKKYGEIGSEYIEVHHKIPVSAMGGSYRLDPINDLVPVCANCHAMLHQFQTPLSIAELKKIIDDQELLKGT